MNYCVRKYKKKKKCHLETYEPAKKIEFSKEQAVPWIIRIATRLAVLGGLISFFASSFLILVRGIFRVEEKVRKFSFRNKIVEIRVKKR